jgi:hypothetical protein
MNNEERKIVKSTLTACSNEFALGHITAEFETERFSGLPLLDTRVELTITPFSITWNDREKLVAELEELLAKYQI